MFEPAQRGTTKEEFSHTPPPLHLQTCDDKQTWGYLLNQSWSRLKMKQVVAIVRICSSPVIVRIHSSSDTLSSLFQADPVQGRVRGKEAADHQLKLSCQETTMSPWLQIHHYSLTGTSKDWSRQPPAASHILSLPPYCQLRLTGCFTQGLRSGKQPGWKPAHCERGGDRSFFRQICFPNITCTQYKNALKIKKELSWSLFNL